MNNIDKYYLFIYHVEPDIFCSTDEDCLPSEACKLNVNRQKRASEYLQEDTSTQRKKCNQIYLLYIFYYFSSNKYVKSSFAV